MGKLVKGLIAAAIPVAVIVGIASCGHRPVVMASAASTTTNYTFNWRLSDQQISTITNAISASSGGAQIEHKYLGASADSIFTYNSTLFYLAGFDYSVTNEGEVTILGNFTWGYWDGRYATGIGYSMKKALAAHPDYFIYAYASISDYSLIEWGFPVIREYTQEGYTKTSITMSYQDPRFLGYPAPEQGNTYKIRTSTLKDHLKQYIVGWLKQDRAPLIDNQQVFDQGKEQGYQEGYADGLSDGKTDGYDDGFIDGRNQGYREGQNSVTNESTAINNLFASLVSVPINVLNGLMPMAVWNTPIVGIMITFMLLAMLMWLIRKLLSR